MKVSRDPASTRLIWNLARTGLYKVNHLRRMSYETLRTLWLEYTCAVIETLDYISSLEEV